MDDKGTPSNTADDTRQAKGWEYETSTGRLLSEHRGVATSWSADDADITWHASTEYRYDPDTGAVSEKLFSQNGSLERREIYRHDPDWGQLTSVETLDAQGRSLRRASYEYDPETGWLLAVNAPEGPISYRRDARGRLIGMTVAGEETRYRWDPRTGQLASVQAPGLATDLDAEGLIAYEYDTFGRKKAVERPNGTKSEWKYDTLTGWLSEIHHTGTTGANQLKLTYHRDASGLIHQIDESESATPTTRTWEYDYDGLKRLTASTRTSGSEVLEWAWAYDRNGNRASQSKFGTATASAYNSADQLVTETTGATAKSFEWDPLGRLHMKLANSNLTRLYEWSADDRLLSAQLHDQPGDPVIHYTYEHLGTRTSRNGPGAGDDDLTRYLPDYENPTGWSQHAAEVNADATQVTKRSYYGDGYGPLAEADDSPAFLLGDHLSTTRGLTDSSGSASYLAYEPFGDVLSGSSSLTNYEFTGQWRDPATSLQQHRARWLDTGRGRWLSQDPVWDWPGNLGNLFAFAGNAPTSYADFSGKMSLGEMVTVAAIVATLVLSAYEAHLTGRNPIIAMFETLAWMAIFYLLFCILAAINPILAFAVAIVFLVFSIMTQIELIKEAYYNGDQKLMWTRVGLLAVSVGTIGLKSPRLNKGALWIQNKLHGFTRKGSSTRALADNDSQSVRGLAGAQAADNSTIILDYQEGSVFSGIYDPDTGAVLLRPTRSTPQRPGALLADGTVPPESVLVEQRGGHGTINRQMMALNSEVSGRKTVGFNVALRNGKLEITGYNSGVNTENYGTLENPNRDYAKNYASQIREAITRAYGVLTVSVLVLPDTDDDQDI